MHRDGARGTRGLLERRQHDLVRVSEAGLLTGERPHANPLFDAGAAVLDHAVLERPGLLVRQLEVQVGEIHRVREGRIGRAVLGPAALLLLAVAAVLAAATRAARLTTSDDAGTVIDYHAHTSASHDGRPGWSLAKLADWHARQGFEATLRDGPQRGLTTVRWLPRRCPSACCPASSGAYTASMSWRSARRAAAPRQLRGSTDGWSRIFAAIERQGGLSIASLPEYWRNHWDDLGAFVLAGVDGFEIVNCAPKALAFPSQLRRDVLTLAGSHESPGRRCERQSRLGSGDVRLERIPPRCAGGLSSATQSRASDVRSVAARASRTLYAP